jgi:hypothetical protein
MESAVRTDVETLHVYQQRSHGGAGHRRSEECQEGQGSCTAQYPDLSTLHQSFRPSVSIPSSIYSKIHKSSQVPVANTYNPSYLESRDQEDHDLKPAQARDPILKMPNTKKDW